MKTKINKMKTNIILPNTYMTTLTMATMRSISVLEAMEIQQVVTEAIMEATTKLMILKILKTKKI